MVIDYTLLYGENDPSNVTSRNREEVFVTMLASCMSFIDSLMVIDYTLLLGETDERAVTSRNTVRCLSQCERVFQEFSHRCGYRAGRWSVYLMGNL